jgi:multiple sugar transport system substrate-binding protein
MTWDTFMDGKYGMLYTGSNVHLDVTKRKDAYPRDWKIGFAPMPVPDGFTQPISWGVSDQLIISSTARYPQEAFDLAIYVSKKVPDFSEGAIPVIKGVDMSNLLSKMVIGLEDDDITEEILNGIFFNPDLKFVHEKPTGPASNKYMDILRETQELYFVQEISLEETIQRIKKLVNEEIDKELSEK